jgi:uncharacterized protein YegL
MTDNNEKFAGNVDFGLDLGNFNPEDLQTDETINAVFILDKSPSMSSLLDGSSQTRIGALNEALNDFIQTMQKSHIADRLLVSVIEFTDRVEVKHGYKPIINVDKFDIDTERGMTACFDAVLLGVKNAVEYRENLEDSGITAKTLVFIITDGDDNSSSPQAAGQVKDILNKINQEEKNIFSFTTILFGIGDEVEYQDAKERMGIQLAAKVGTTGEEIRKMINWISSSVSSASNNQNLPDINF